MIRLSIILSKQIMDHRKVFFRNIRGSNNSDIIFRKVGMVHGKACPVLFFTLVKSIGCFLSLKLFDLTRNRSIIGWGLKNKNIAQAIALFHFF